MTKRIFGVGAMVLVFCTAAFQADAAFYLRPELQISSLATSSHADSDIAIGGGLAWGAVFGRDKRFDVGAEFSQVRYKADFDCLVYFGSGAGDTVRKKVPVISTVETRLATFRYSFGSKNEKVRPFLALALGHSTVSIPQPIEAYRPNSAGGSLVSSGYCWTAALSGGVSYQLFRLTSVEMGYRYIFSDSVSLSSYTYKFRNNAHVITIAVAQRFGSGGS